MMKKQIMNVSLAMCPPLGLLPTAVWAATPIADENGDYDETEGLL